VFDESWKLLRLMLREERVSFMGRYFSVDGASVGPLPLKPLDIWTGGSAPGAFRRPTARRRVARQLPHAQESRAAREAIQATAAEAGREIEADHFGISLAVSHRGSRTRWPPRPAAAPEADRGADRGRLGQRPPDDRGYVAAGLSKFVVRPARASDTPAALEKFLDRFAAEMLPLQS